MCVSLLETRALRVVLELLPRDLDQPWVFSPFPQAKMQYTREQAKSKASHCWHRLQSRSQKGLSFHVLLSTLPIVSLCVYVCLSVSSASSMLTTTSELHPGSHLPCGKSQFPLKLKTPR